MITCPKCGVLNSPDSIACSSCNTLLGNVNSTGGNINLSKVNNDNNINNLDTNDYIELKANPKISDENNCKVCFGKIEVGDDIIKCQKCSSYFHKNCYQNNGGCNSPTCSAEEETKTCRYCNRSIKKSALKCRYCGRYLDTMLQHEEVLPKGTHPDATKVLIYGILSIFCCAIILGPLAIIKGNEVLNDIKLDPGYSGGGMAKAGLILGIIGLSLWGISLLFRIIGYVQ